MSDKKLYILAHDTARKLAHDAVESAPDGYFVRIEMPTRTSEQNAKFHAICSDIAKSKLPWAGKPRTSAQWKVLLVSAHSIATKEGAEMVPGIESEYVNLRESTALMSKKRGSSLIEYSLAFCATNGIAISERDFA